jgi:APA family basic amino acid/polyamine antiporter
LRFAYTGEIKKRSLTILTDYKKRSEGLSTVTAITFAVGTMVGAGVFVLSGLVVNVAGPGALLSYSICAVLVAFSGLSYAMLASIFPEDGGGYLYSEKMLGKYPGFLSGWIMYIAQPIALSFVLLGFGIYLNLLLSISTDPRVFAAAALLLITVLNMRGIAEAGRFELAVVVTKVAILVLFFFVGLLYLQFSDFEPFLPQGTSGVFQGVTMVFFAYMGFQVITMMAGEVKQSEKKVPIAMLASIVIVAFIYIGVILALLAASLPTYGSESVFDAAIVLLGPMGGALVALGAVLSTLSSANALTAGASRIIMEMASEKQVPGRFAKLKHNQPTNAIVLGSGVAMIFIFYGSLDAIIGLVNIAMLIAMFFVNVSAYVLTKNESALDIKRGYFRVPLGPVFPILGALSCVAISLTISPVSVIIGFAALFIGSILYIIEDTPEGEREVENIKRILKRQIPLGSKSENDQG